MVKDPITCVYVSPSVKSLAKKKIDDQDVEDSSTSTPSKSKVSLGVAQMLALAAPCKTDVQDFQYDNLLVAALVLLVKF